MTALVVFVVAGAGTYLARSIFVLAVGERVLPNLLERAIRNVGPVVLAALTASLLLTDGVGEYATDPAQVAATAVAVLVAWRSRSYLLVFVAGMAVLWGIRFLT